MSPIGVKTGSWEKTVKLTCIEVFKSGQILFVTVIFEWLCWPISELLGVKLIAPELEPILNKSLSSEKVIGSEPADASTWRKNSRFVYANCGEFIVSIVGFTAIHISLDATAFPVIELIKGPTWFKRIMEPHNKQTIITI